MATKEQKLKALNQAVEIAKEQARGGGSATVSVLQSAYKAIIDIVDKIEQAQD